MREIRDSKAPHWTGAGNSPGTHGHFGRSGTFLWVDPAAGIALTCLTDLAFGAWAGEAWPRLADDVLALLPMSERIAAMVDADLFAAGINDCGLGAVTQTGAVDWPLE